MKRNLFISFMALFILTIFSCKKNNNNEIGNIMYGASSGICTGYCVREISISKNEITFLKKKYGNSPEPKTCTKPVTSDEVNALKTLINASEFRKLPDVIGCPDCADGGAEFVSLRLDGKLKTVKFQSGNAPKELEELVLKLRAIKEEFNYCN